MDQAAETAEGSVTRKPEFASLDNSLLGQNLYRFLQDCASQAVPFGDRIADYLQDMIREAALLDALWTTLRNGHPNGSPAKTLLTIASLDEHGRAACIRLRDLYRTLFEKEFGCTTSVPGKAMSSRFQEMLRPAGHVEFLVLDGALANVLAPLEAGTHLFVFPNDAYVPLVVSSRPLEESISVASKADRTTGLPSVLRIYSDAGATLDIRSRLLARGKLGNAELRAFILSALAPPRELISSEGL
jgi:hypothetical protein